MKTDKKPKIAFIDDDKFIAKMYGSYFEKVGFEVRIYIGVPDNFVEEMAKENPDIISMDIIMAGIDGFTATKLLKADKRTSHIPVFGLSNLGNEETFEDAKKVGMEQYHVTGKTKPDEYVKLIVKHSIEQKKKRMEKDIECFRQKFLTKLGVPNNYVPPDCTYRQDLIAFNKKQARKEELKKFFHLNSIIERVFEYWRVFLGFFFSATVVRVFIEGALRGSFWAFGTGGFWLMGITGAYFGYGWHLSYKEKRKKQEKNNEKHKREFNKEYIVFSSEDDLRDHVAQFDAYGNHNYSFFNDAKGLSQYEKEQIRKRSYQYDGHILYFKDELSSSEVKKIEERIKEVEKMKASLA